MPDSGGGRRGAPRPVCQVLYNLVLRALHCKILKNANCHQCPLPRCCFGRLLPHCHQRPQPLQRSMIQSRLIMKQSRSRTVMHWYDRNEEATQATTKDRNGTGQYGTFRRKKRSPAFIRAPRYNSFDRKHRCAKARRKARVEILYSGTLSERQRQLRRRNNKLQTSPLLPVSSRSRRRTGTVCFDVATERRKAGQGLRCDGTL